MRDTLALMAQGFESDSQTTEEFQHFVNTFKREFKKTMQLQGFEKIKVSQGHFYVSGFFTYKEQPYYFSITDVRGCELAPELSMMFRTAQHYKDFTGGTNQYVRFDERLAERLFEAIAN